MISANARNEAKKKAADIVSKMTIEEKCSQLLYNSPAIKRLKIDEYNWWNEGIHGVARAGTATVFPQAIGLAATFDTDLLEKVGDVVSTEGRAKYNTLSALGDRGIYKGLSFWSPNINIFRDPRWGRGHETYGEDPYLTSRMGVSYVDGVQGDGDTLKAAACAKHFAVHSGPEEGRHSFDAKADAKDMNETYLYAFKSLVQESEVEAVMGAYNRLNGEACCGSKTLFTDILRKEWGFDGHIVSDFLALHDLHEHHKVTATPEETCALSLRSGIDLNAGDTYDNLMNAYDKKMITEDDITNAAIRVFTTRYLLGIMPGEKTSYDNIGYDSIECDKHLQLCERAALESFVLLKNNGILPLDRASKQKIAVIGPNADERESLIGNYHGTGSRNITVLEGIREYLGEDADIMYSSGCDICLDKTEPLARDYDRLSEAMAVANQSDVVILCLGLNEHLEGEEGDAGNHYASGDKKDLFLPKSQQMLMEAVKKTGKPVITILLAGSDIDLSYANENFDAVIDCWYPGELGGRALAKILFGEESPSGKLPITFYEPDYELPEFTDYSMDRRTYRYIKGQAQYPFGYGLTYGNVVVKSAESDFGRGTRSITNFAKEDNTFTVTVNAQNESDVPTDEVIEVYVSLLDAPDDKAVWSLCGFARAHFKPNEKRTLYVKIRKNSLKTVDDKGQLRSEGTKAVLYVGCSQPDERSIALTGQKPIELILKLY